MLKWYEKRRHPQQNPKAGSSLWTSPVPDTRPRASQISPPLHCWLIPIVTMRAAAMKIMIMKLSDKNLPEETNTSSINWSRERVSQQQRALVKKMEIILAKPEIAAAAILNAPNAASRIFNNVKTFALRVSLSDTFIELVRMSSRLLPEHPPGSAGREED